MKYYTEENMMKQYGSLDKVNWEDVCFFRPLSEQLIEQYIDKFDWYTICCRQQLSTQFIIKHYDNIKWTGLFANQKASDFIRNLAVQIWQEEITKEEACKLLKSDYSKIMDKL